MNTTVKIPLVASLPPPILVQSDKLDIKETAPFSHSPTLSIPGGLSAAENCIIVSPGF